MTIRIEGTLRRGELGLDLDVEIEAGRTTIVGTNGTGKTTLLRLVAGLEALEEGTVHINGRLVDDGGSNFVAAHERPTALVFQEHRLFPHLRAIDNVAFPLRRNGVHRVDAHERSLAMLGRVGMHELADRRPQQLSNGQQQRVAIARAL
ncbi:MAG: ATP-binding cassette domain-containing protein, partial [Actinomycetia bacterium]|nr:ATP-binding cassette domain-containing protein [Actinomycetes bacterium]